MPIQKTAFRDRIKAKADLYTFLYESTDDLLNLSSNKTQLVKELIHYSVRFLFPAYKTADEIEAECREICSLFHCYPPENIRALVSSSMVDKAFGTLPPDLKS
jgi:hypothetical protein